MDIGQRILVFFRIGILLWVGAASFWACDSTPSSDLDALAPPSNLDASVRADVEVLSRFAAERLAGVPDPEIFFDSLKSMADATKTPSGMDMSIEILKHIVYGHWAISFDPDQDDIQALLPHTIISRKSGSCLGVSLIFLMLAEEIRVPLRGVVLPGHFFVRYRENGLSRNIEPNREGYAHPDQYYRERYGVSDSSGYYLHDLTKREAVGVLCYNLGNAFREKGRSVEAQALYRAAIERFDTYAEAWGNYAIVLNLQGRDGRAWAAMDSAYRRNPELPGMLENRAALALASQYYEKAETIYNELLLRKADDPEALLGLAYTYLGMKNSEKVESALRRLERSHSEYPVPPELRRMLKEEP